VPELIELMLEVFIDNQELLVFSLHPQEICFHLPVLGFQFVDVDLAILEFLVEVVVGGPGLVKLSPEQVDISVYLDLESIRYLLTLLVLAQVYLQLFPQFPTFILVFSSLTFQMSNNTGLFPNLSI